MAVGIIVVAASMRIGSAQRLFMTERHAWGDQDILIVKGIVSKIRYEQFKSVFYTVSVSEVLKSNNAITLSDITVCSPQISTDSMTPLKLQQNIVLFLRPDSPSCFSSHREFRLDDPSDASMVRGLRLFLRLMEIQDKIKQRQQCLTSWSSASSDPEKRAVLDVMWETRFPGYGHLLMEAARGQDSPSIRAWAITILAYLDVSEPFDQLVPMLDHPDYELRRQLLLLFGAHKVKAAVPAIEKMLKAPILADAVWQADALKSMATEALDKISGKDASSAWK